MAKEKIRLLEEKLLEEREVVPVIGRWAIGGGRSPVGSSHRWGGGHRGVSAALFHSTMQFHAPVCLHIGYQLVTLIGFILFFSLCSLKED